MLEDSEGPTIGGWELATSVSEWIEAIAILAIAMSVLIAFIAGAREMRAAGAAQAIEEIKYHIGRGLLLGLDLLIAADIIRTVTLEATLENVVALGVLVLVRTVLTWTIVVELEGRWPWQLGPSRRTRTSADT